MLLSFSLVYFTLLRLQVMWLSSDFEMERKWKMAAAKRLARFIPEYANMST